MTRKPGVLDRGHAGFVATERLREGDDLEWDAVRIQKREFVLHVVEKPVQLRSIYVQAPGAEPVTFGIRNCRPGAAFDLRFGNGWHHQIGAG